MTLRSRDKTALAIVGGVLVIVLFYLLVFMPVHRHVSRLDASIAAQQQMLSQDQVTYQAGKAARTELRKNRAQWNALRRAVPRTSDIPALLRTLQRDADTAHVKMQAITLSGGSATVAEPSTSPTGAGASAANSVPVSLTFSGSYQALDRLIHRLDALVVVSGDHVRASGPLLSISNVSLTGAASKLTAQLSASIYQLGSTTTPSASAATP